ncbi:ATP-dependent helicase [Methanococcus voltae]|uniref:DNA 3'-5' helicase n=1 Tax=Methanococcus voltae (strain ATCC BAA-1334 / A3) TaxID=456320 RepID=D7DSU3_METV3|nr:ATP-dependent DNA helicase [Methanococcus voltae]MCS3901804.1 DNA helicase-2/ATP-dependent DNA helicase PcrA [Methanococcus voltae]
MSNEIEITKREPNESQKRAIEYTNGPLLILAGPGSGKTFTITNKIISLIENQNLKPEKILALTFSEKAANEMLTRVEKEIGLNTGISISTFHSFCNDLINEFAFEIGRGSNLKLISKEHACVFGVKNIDSFNFETIKVKNNSYGAISKLYDGISQFYDFLVSPEELNNYITTQLPNEEDEEKIEELKKLYDLCKYYKAYKEYKLKNGLIDYNDMISIVCNLLKENTVIKKKLQDRYDYILVDEFQDTNFAQLDLITKLVKNDNLTCVADDDQCIYRFRGAYLTNIKELNYIYPALEKITLDVNYRSTDEIVELSKELIQNNPNRENKESKAHDGNGEKIKILKTPDDYSEAEWVAEEIEKLISTKNDDDLTYEPKDIFILTRTIKDGKKYSEALKNRMIPSEYIGNHNLQEQPIIKDVLAYINVVSNPFESGVDFKRIFTREGVDEHDIQKINQKAKELSYKNAEGDGIYYTLQMLYTNEYNEYNEYNKDNKDNKDNNEELDTLTNSNVDLNLNLDLEDKNKDILLKIFENIKELICYKKNHKPSDTLIYLLNKKTDIYKIEAYNDTKLSRKNIHLLNSLVNVVEDFEETSNLEFENISEYLNILSNLEIQQENEFDNSNTVKIMTIHQSKGKEAKVVFIGDLADRHLPLRYNSKEFTVPVELMKSRIKNNVPEKELHKEEELRLLYVAMTRAMKKLYLVYPKRYTGNKRDVKPSEFLEYINHIYNEKVEFIESKPFENHNVYSETLLSKKINEYEKLVSKYTINKMYDKALNSLITLAKLNEVEKSGNLTGFDLNDVLKLDKNCNIVNKENITNANNTNNNEDEKITRLINNEIQLPPLVNPDMAFSPSKIVDYDSCPLMFKYKNVLSIPTPKKSYFSVGNTVHKIFEILGDKKINDERITIEMAQNMLLENLKEQDFDSKTEYDEQMTNCLNMLNYWFEFEKNNVDKIISVEEKFSINLCNHTINGIIDRIDKTTDDNYIVLDYKTGKTALSKNKLLNNIQLIIYAIAVKEKYGKYPIQIGHIYPAIAKSVILDIEESKIEEIKQNIESYIDKIMNEDFEVVKNPSNCHFCDYKNICEYLNNE